MSGCGEFIEPWRAHGDDWIEAGDNILLARLADVYADAEKARQFRRRIIACVNACASLDTKGLESGALARAICALCDWLEVADTSDAQPGSPIRAALDALRELTGMLPTEGE